MGFQDELKIIQSAHKGLRITSVFGVMTAAMKINRAF